MGRGDTHASYDQHSGASSCAYLLGLTEDISMKENNQLQSAHFGRFGCDARPHASPELEHTHNETREDEDRKQCSRNFGTFL